MEQTLGKRIAENRKRLKLTQDQLAEKLGITAQAVSKWENDQSCPDITMLPRLAEIFGTTTDALLGMEPQTPVHEAEVVEDAQNSNTGVHLEWNDAKNDGKWEFHWDSGKRQAMVFAVTVVAVGMLTLASRILEWDVSFWEILWPCSLIAFGISNIVKEFSIFHLSVLIFGGYGLVTNLGFLNFGYDGSLVFPIILVLFGLSLLTDALKKPSKPRFRVIHNGNNVRDGEKKTEYTASTDKDTFSCSLSFGEKTHQVHVPVLRWGDVSVSFGELTLDLTGCETVEENCGINANCSFGELELLVPRKFRVEPRSSTAFASVELIGHPDSEPAGILYLDANVSFGEIRVRYI